MSNNLLPFFLISAFVALLDILPFIYKRCPWRYKAAVYLQVFATGMVVFCISPGLLPWWATGLAVGACLFFRASSCRPFAVHTPGMPRFSTASAWASSSPSYAIR